MHFSYCRPSRSSTIYITGNVRMYKNFQNFFENDDIQHLLAFGQAGEGRKSTSIFHSSSQYLPAASVVGNWKKFCQIHGTFLSLYYIHCKKFHFVNREREVFQKNVGVDGYMGVKD
ncbi:MAG: hypothetical protein ACFWUL_07465 [Dialister sp.]